ncbi:MAG: hypothetical protein IT572_11385 [Deltaproteobacteria bacterium]|nr:hypothetical protein [Deltaproteobacteria bacterium]
MQTSRFPLLGLFLLPFALNLASAQAEDIGHGSLRVTLPESAAAQLKVRYENLQGLLEKDLGADETLKFNRYSVLQPQKILIPFPNQFTAYKTGGQLVLQFNGDALHNAVFLRFEKEGLQQQLALPSDLEVEVSEAGLAEAVDENDQPLFEIGGDPVVIQSFAGMGIRFAVTLDPPQPEPEVPADSEDPPVPVNPQAPVPLGSASGGCALGAPHVAGFSALAAWPLLLLTAAAARFRKN